MKNLFCIVLSVLLFQIPLAFSEAPRGYITQAASKRFEEGGGCSGFLESSMSLCEYMIENAPRGPLSGHDKLSLGIDLRSIHTNLNLLSENQCEAEAASVEECTDKILNSCSYCQERWERFGEDDDE